MNVSLTPYFDEFIRHQVDSGRYHSASEVIRHALRLLEDQAERRNELRSELVLGLESGESRPLDAQAIKHRGRTRLASTKEE